MNSRKSAAACWKIHRLKGYESGNQEIRKFCETGIDEKIEAPDSCVPNLIPSLGLLASRLKV
jgi:hypothetical protein